MGILAYTVTVPKPTKNFTEFYILGHERKANNYPIDFKMIGSHVTEVSYEDTFRESASYGKVTLGIINHEQQKTSYSLKIIIDGEPMDLIYNGQSIKQVEAITLALEEKWEEDIGFAPRHTGENQKVEFFLYKDGRVNPYLDLYLLIKARE
jgi:uncharacterized membrane protein